MILAIYVISLKWNPKMDLVLFVVDTGIHDQNATW